MGLGAEVVIASRDTKKAEDAAKEINKETGNKVSVVKLDLGSMASIRTAAEEVKEKYPLIHLLVNNAGILICVCVCVLEFRANTYLLFRGNDMPSVVNRRWF